MGVGYGEGCPLSSRLGGLWERPELPSGFWRILKTTERSFLYLCDKNLRGTICTTVSLLQILGGLVPRVPRDLRPCLAV